MSSKLIKRFQFYKLENINGQNNWVLYDTETEKINNEISLVNICDILQDREFFEVYNLVNPFTPIQDTTKITKEQLRELKKKLTELQKQVFYEIKKIVLTEKINIDSLIYEPTEKKLITKNKSKFFNTNKFICPYSTQKKEKYDFPLYEKLLKNILQEGYEKFLKQMAWKKQHPTIQIPCNWIIQDDGGTGKTEILGDYLLDKLFGYNSADQEDLETPYTPYLAGAPYLIFDEIEGYDDEKKIKRITGAKKHLIKDKYEKGYYTPNYITIIINSNELRAMRISEKDRRFNVVGGGKRLSPLNETEEEWKKTLFGSKEENEKFFKKFHETYETELDNLNAYLHNLEVNRLDIQIPLQTKQKQDLIEINYNSEQSFIIELFENGLTEMVSEYLYSGSGNFFKDHIFKTKDETHITIKGIYKLYSDYSSANKLKGLSKNNFLRRLMTYDIFNKIFEKSRIKIEGTDYKTLKINNKYLQKVIRDEFEEKVIDKIESLDLSEEDI